VSSALTANAWLRSDAICEGLRIAGPNSILEIGPGLGAMAMRLSRYYDYTGVELDPSSYQILRKKLEVLGRGSAVEDFASIVNGSKFDLVCAFEVLEHICDDVGALRSWRALLKPTGYLMLSVPAHARKFGPLDEFVGHFRRYERAELRAKLEQTGFEVNWIDCHGMLLGQGLHMASNAITRRGARQNSRDEATGASARLLQPSSSVEALFRWAISLPFRWMQRPFRRLDFGSGYVALARVASNE
jgi:SAM-dependent methyltransferase